MKMQNGNTKMYPYLGRLTLFSRYFNRDVNCIRDFFRRRFRFESAKYPIFQRTIEEGAVATGNSLGLDVEANGSRRKIFAVLDKVRFFFQVPIGLTRHLFIVPGSNQ
jgi:hypothetical protein